MSTMSTSVAFAKPFLASRTARPAGQHCIITTSSLSCGEIQGHLEVSCLSAQRPIAPLFLLGHYRRVTRRSWGTDALANALSVSCDCKASRGGINTFHHVGARVLLCPFSSTKSSACACDADWGPFDREKEPCPFDAD